jgi:hypothetical protein
MAIQFMNALLGKPARSTGRRRKFDDATKQRVQSELRDALLIYEKNNGKLPNEKHTARLVRTFAQVAGVTAEPITLKRSITRPVLKELKLRRRK